MTCTCGETKPHVIAKRVTFDGKHVHLWNDGSLTWALGFSIRGSAHPRNDEQRRDALRAGWLVLGEVCLYAQDEVPELVRAARAVAKRRGLPGDVRALIRKRREEAGRLKPVWQVYQADRDGRATVRVWRLPRMKHPRMLVWWEVSGSSGRPYQVMSIERGRTLFGARAEESLSPMASFRTMRELQCYLDSVRSLSPYVRSSNDETRHYEEVTSHELRPSHPRSSRCSQDGFQVP